MKTQYKLLKDLPGYKAGTVFEKAEGKYTTQELGNGGAWKYIDNLITAYEDQELDISDYLQPLPQPKEEKKEYVLLFVAGSADDALLNHFYDLTEPAAQAVATAIEALLGYVNGQPHSHSGYISAAQDAREAVQKDKS